VTTKHVKFHTLLKFYTLLKCYTLPASLLRQLSVTRYIALALVVVALAANQALAGQLAGLLGKRVVRVDIVVEGAPGTDTAEMRSLIEVAPGQDFSPVRIHDSLVRLYNSGLISGARVEAASEAVEGVALRFVVKPQARIEQVIFQGNTIFAVEELRARLNQLDPGLKLSPAAVERGLSELQAFYSARGYYQANIASEVRLTAAGTRAIVIYNISPGEQARVSKLAIEIKGAKLDLSAIKHAVVEGKPFTQADVQEEMSRIQQVYLQQGYLAVRISSSITPDPAAGSVQVGIEVISGPKVNVEVKGLTISEKKKREILPFYTQGGLDDFAIEDGRRRLLDYAQREGYFFAEVSRPAVPDLSLGEVSLVYEVAPGQRYRLTEIIIRGLQAIPESDLKRDLKSKEASPLVVLPLVGSFFGTSIRGITSDDMLRQDANTIQKRLRDIGYRRAHVDILRGVSPTGADLIITFDVKQGPRTFIDEIGIRGNAVFTSEQLRARLPVKPKDPLVASEVGRGSDQLLAAYNAQGYASAEVFTEVVELGNANGQELVRLIYNVTEGNRARILRISTRGTAHADEVRLERDFYLFKEGDWLRRDKLQETERALFDTNAFNSVSIHSEPVGRTPNGIEEHNVTVDLADAKRYLLVYGFGFQSRRQRPTLPGLGLLHGARGFVQLTNTNMFRRLYAGSIQFRVSQDELLGQISFQDPRPFGYNLPGLISLFARRLAEPSFNSDRYTAVAQIERRLSPREISYFSYSFERVSVFDAKVSEEELPRDQRSIRLGRLSSSYLRDTRDNSFEPTKGTLTSGNFSIALSALGGTAEFTRMLIAHGRTYPVLGLRDVYYSVSGRVGLAAPFGRSDKIPISERFFAGGATDLRGFGTEEAGPHELVQIRDPNTGNVLRVESRPVGGNALIVINNELRFPIWGVLGGTIFSDTGNVFRRVRDISPSSITETLGFGLRVKTPIGPLRFDVGFLVINRPAGAPRGRGHFSFGQVF
jgi:outer membrane protein insertion porin family